MKLLENENTKVIKISNTILFKDGELDLKVSIDDETVWLTQKQLGELFNVEVHTVNYHIKNIFKQKELEQNLTIRKIRIVQSEGNRKVKRNVDHYNLDMVISVGYRVNSITATKFRQWATKVLTSYIQDGYVLNNHKITEQRLFTIENDIQSIKSHIKNDTLELKEGIFYDGQIFDAYVFLSNIIRSAKTKIVIIDNYIDDSLLTSISKNQNIKVIIYTQTITKQLKLDIQKYNNQYTNLSVKIIKNFHDRFIIIDEKDVYHIGASLKDLGKKVFAFSKIELNIDELVKLL